MKAKKAIKAIKIITAFAFSFVIEMKTYDDSKFKTPFLQQRHAQVYGIK